MRTGLAMLAVLISGATASATTFTIPLDGLRGVYSTAQGPSPDGVDWAPYTRTVSFDAGFGFERVDSIRIHVTGTSAPALFRYVPSRPPQLAPYTQSEPAPYVVFQIGSQQPPGWGRGRLDPRAGTFDVDVDLTNLLNLEHPQDWSGSGFLTGRGQVEVQFGPFNWIANYYGPDLTESGLVEQDVPALAGVADAYLLIDGVAVPEPTSLWVVAAFALGLTLRRTRASRGN